MSRVEPPKEPIKHQRALSRGRTTRIASIALSPKKKIVDIKEATRRFIKKETRQRLLSLGAAVQLRILAEKAGGRTCICLEIGSGIGGSGVIIGTAIKKKSGRLFSIDNFLVPPVNTSLSSARAFGEWGNKPWGPEVYRKNLKRFGIDPIMIIGNSMEIIPLFKDEFFDLIWIDGCHEYKVIKKDILNSIPKLKKGGILCGHDFRKKPDAPHNGVKTAVKEIFGDNFWLPKRVKGGRIWVMGKEKSDKNE